MTTTDTAPAAQAEMPPTGGGVTLHWSADHAHPAFATFAGIVASNMSNAATVPPQGLPPDSPLAVFSAVTTLPPGAVYAQALGGRTDPAPMLAVVATFREFAAAMAVSVAAEGVLLLEGVVVPAASSPPGTAPSASEPWLDAVRAKLAAASPPVSSSSSPPCAPSNPPSPPSPPQSLRTWSALDVVRAVRAMGDHGDDALAARFLDTWR